MTTIQSSKQLIKFHPLHLELRGMIALVKGTAPAQNMRMKSLVLDAGSPLMLPHASTACLACFIRMLLPPVAGCRRHAIE